VTEKNIRCGFVSLLGRPNVGKSTLMNRILGSKIAITSSKPQTTRNRIVGIHTTDNAQIVFLDTPGIHIPKKDMNKKMVKAAKLAAWESDLAVMLIEANNPWRDEDVLTLDLVEKLEVKKILVINKIDLVDKARILPLIENSSKLEVFDEIVPLSAKKGDNLERFTEVACSYLPEAPPLFPPDVLTDQAERFWVAEIVREKIVRFTRQELPYSSSVLVEDFKEDDKIIRIKAAVLVERENQKRMIIGKGGQMVKKIGTSARHDIESFLNKKIYLELFVKEDKNWWREQGI
jgi:GTPase